MALVAPSWPLLIQGPDFLTSASRVLGFQAYTRPSTPAVDADPLYACCRLQILIVKKKKTNIVKFQIS